MWPTTGGPDDRGGIVSQGLAAWGSEFRVVGLGFMWRDLAGQPGWGRAGRAICSKGLSDTLQDACSLGLDFCSKMSGFTQP